MGDLVERLVALALDPSEALPLRVDAAAALASSSDREARARLVQLATEVLPEDDSDELKGHALDAVWPDHLGASALFAVLTPPKRDTLFGAYGRFLRDRVVPGLDSHGLALALEWWVRLDDNRLDSHFEDLADAIIEAGWERFESDSRVREAFVEVVAVALSSFNPLIRRAGRERVDAFGDDGRRHLLVQELVPRLAKMARDEGRMGGLLVASRPPLLLPVDLAWAVARLEQSVGTEDEGAWAQVAEAALRPLDAARVDVLFAAREMSAEFAALTSASVAPIDLSSDFAQRQRDLWGRGDARRRDEAAAVTATELAKRVGRDLDGIEAGAVERWIDLNLALAADSRTGRYQPFESDLTATPGWKVASADTRARVVEAAKRFASSFECDASEGFGEASYPQTTLAGPRALLLLIRLAPEAVASLDDVALARWSPAVVGFPVVGDEAVYLTLLHLLWERVPQDVLLWLTAAIRREAQGDESQHLWTLRRFKGIHDRRLDAALGDLARDHEWPAQAFGDLLDFLLSRQSAPARDVAAAAMSGEMHAEAERDRAIVAAGKLMEHAPDCGWGVVWPLMQRHPEVGRAILEMAAAQTRGRLEVALSEGDLGDLLLWLEGQFPSHEDPPETGFVTGRGQIPFLRNSLLNELVARATSVAVAQLRRLESALPQLGYLGRVVSRADDRVREASWTPPSPTAVVCLGQVARARLVVSSDHLVEVVLESLERIQGLLQGETRAVVDVWDTQTKSTRPKSENEVSDRLKRFLEEDLNGRRVVVNREVEVRSGPGGRMGERVDLHVVALTAGESECQVIVEVKACWHDDLKTAMKDQLLGQYLEPLDLAAGIYLVGWFGGARWADGDSRREKCRKWDRRAAAIFFDTQAAELTADSGRSVRSIVLDLSY